MGQWLTSLRGRYPNNTEISEYWTNMWTHTRSNDSSTDFFCIMPEAVMYVLPAAFLAVLLLAVFIIPKAKSAIESWIFQNRTLRKLIRHAPLYILVVIPAIFVCLIILDYLLALLLDDADVFEFSTSVGRFTALPKASFALSSSFILALFFVAVQKYKPAWLKYLWEIRINATQTVGCFFLLFTLLSVSRLFSCPIEPGMLERNLQIVLHLVELVPLLVLSLLLMFKGSESSFWTRAMWVGGVIFTLSLVAETTSYFINGKLAPYAFQQLAFAFEALLIVFLELYPTLAKSVIFFTFLNTIDKNQRDSMKFESGELLDSLNFSLNFFEKITEEGEERVYLRFRTLMEKSLSEIIPSSEIREKLKKAVVKQESTDSKDSEEIDKTGEKLSDPYFPSEKLLEKGERWWETVIHQTLNAISSLYGVYFLSRTAGVLEVGEKYVYGLTCEKGTKTTKVRLPGFLGPSCLSVLNSGSSLPFAFPRPRASLPNLYRCSMALVQLARCHLQLWPSTLYTATLHVPHSTLPFRPISPLLEYVFVCVT
uniref:Uncharacterized protein n=1 Tax=Palpitomonas bilix TaxID=652834 RepID=A0A7S3DA85_9EUKA|mmetsp:Transcript_28085/g.71590  ORF Transcript_28085/g.71590 Transcript_28085/m.71590 type:complete len:539 (+) Transcript_28085:63-1679(+)